MKVEPSTGSHHLAAPMLATERSPNCFKRTMHIEQQNAVTRIIVKM